MEFRSLLISKLGRTECDEPLAIIKEDSVTLFILVIAYGDLTHAVSLCCLLPHCLNLLYHNCVKHQELSQFFFPQKDP